MALVATAVLAAVYGALAVVACPLVVKVLSVLAILTWVLQSHLLTRILTMPQFL